MASRTEPAVLVVEVAGVVRASNVGTSVAAGRRRSSNGRHHESELHLEPFCRSGAPARPMPFPSRTLASLADASLFDLRTWPAADRGTGPGGRRGGDAHGASADTQLQHAEASRAAVQAHTERRTAVRGHNAHKSAVASDTAHRARAGTRPTRSPMPPISGHGAPNVMKVTASDTISEPLKAWSWRSRLSSFDGAAPLHRAATPGPDLHR